MLTRVRLTNARTVRGWPTLKNNTECFRNGLVNSAALSQFKQCVTLLLILVDTECKELYLPLLVTRIHCTMWWVWKHICQYQWSWDKPYSPGCNHLCHMLQACLLWRCAYFQTLSWNDTIFVVDWDILYKLCGSANKWSKGFVFSGKIWWQFFSCIVPVVRPRPNIRSHSVLLPVFYCWVCEAKT